MDMQPPSMATSRLDTRSEATLVNGSVHDSRASCFYDSPFLPYRSPAGQTSSLLEGNARSHICRHGC